MALAGTVQSRRRMLPGHSEIGTERGLALVSLCFHPPDRQSMPISGSDILERNRSWRRRHAVLERGPGETKELDAFGDCCTDASCRLHLAPAPELVRVERCIDQGSGSQEMVAQAAVGSVPCWLRPGSGGTTHPGRPPARCLRLNVSPSCVVWPAQERHPRGRCLPLHRHPMISAPTDVSRCLSLPCGLSAAVSVLLRLLLVRWK